MAEKTGVYTAKKKNGEVYYRASLTYRKKHISLGSFDNIDDANTAYSEARSIIEHPEVRLEDYKTEAPSKLPFDKYIIIINFRDNNIYFSTPIYIYLLISNL